MTTYININGDVRDAASLTVPADRTFRGAWQFNGDAVEIDMIAAVEIQKDKIRAERSEKWPVLDASFMQALETNDTAAQAAIAAVKQAHRDVTSDPRLAAATTPEELKALDLATLLGE